MSYTPQTWVNGDIITATKLNNIESGVQSVSNSYTPTTWVNGDIITATKLNNIEQGIANAGGGSSDIPTFKVRIINNSANDIAEGNFFDAFQDLLYVTTYGLTVTNTDASALTGTIYAESEKEIAFTYRKYNGYISIPNDPSYSYSDLVNIVGSYDEYYNEFSGDFESLAEITDASMTITIS